MKKAELELKLLELEKKIKELETRPTIYCLGHTCHCNHYNYPIYPSNPWYTNPTYTLTSGGTTMSTTPNNFQITGWADGMIGGTTVSPITESQEVSCCGNH